MKASLRRHLKLEDEEGISSLCNEEIFEHLAHMSSKKTAWDQFSSNIATAPICLATSRRFNLSKFIFDAMVKNLDSPHKFLFKLFSNMRRASKGYLGVVTSLFENMLVQAHDEEQQQSPLRITSSPSLSPQPTQPSPSTELIQPTHEAEETASMPHDSPLHDVHSHGSAEGSVQQHDLMVLVTKLNDQIDRLEKDLKRKFMRSLVLKLKYLYKKRLPLKLLKNIEVVRKVRWRLVLQTYRIHLDRDFLCCDSGWRNDLFCHLRIEFFLFRVSTQALIPLVGSLTEWILTFSL
ncbi:hypothetical protein Tco_0643285 [Tanacetum coccineum]